MRPPTTCLRATGIGMRSSPKRRNPWKPSTQKKRRRRRPSARRTRSRSRSRNPSARQSRKRSLRSPPRTLPGPRRTATMPNAIASPRTQRKKHSLGKSTRTTTERNPSSAAVKAAGRTQRHRHGSWTASRKRKRGTQQQSTQRRRERPQCDGEGLDEGSPPFPTRRTDDDETETQRRHQLVPRHMEWLDGLHQVRS